MIYPTSPLWTDRDQEMSEPCRYCEKTQEFRALVDELINQSEIPIECFFCNEIGYGKHTDDCIIERIQGDT